MSWLLKPLKSIGEIESRKPPALDQSQQSHALEPSADGATPSAPTKGGVPWTDSENSARRNILENGWVCAGPYVMGSPGEGANQPKPGAD